MDREEMRLLYLLLAPVSRIHGYLSHIQVSQRLDEVPHCSQEALKTRNTPQL